MGSEYGRTERKILKTQLWEEREFGFQGDGEIRGKRSSLHKSNKLASFLDDRNCREVLDRKREEERQENSPWGIVNSQSLHDKTRDFHIEEASKSKSLWKRRRRDSARRLK